MYAACEIGTKTAGTRKHISLHRTLMNPPDDMVVDHINGNGLDNRRVNLRICTRAQNNHNKKKMGSNTSGFVGVYKYAPHGTWDGRWYALVTVAGRTKHLGTFKIAEDAARAYDAAAKELIGEYARLNFPESPLPDVLADDATMFVAHRLATLACNNTSGYIGVQWIENRKGWLAKVSWKGRGISAGVYDTPELAARVHDAVARVLSGEDARVNFP